ncbi:MAG: 4-alpha-glucanotransferase [Gemmatimonadaceae bacterium]
MSPAKKRARPARKSAGRGDAALRRLADMVGIVDSYVDQTGRERHTRDDTRVAILAAMGIDASTAAAAGAALERRQAERRERVLPVARVVRRSDLAAEVALGPGAAGARRWEAVLRTESGEDHVLGGRLRAARGGLTARLPLDPALMPAGYHRLTVRLDGAREATQPLVVVPDACPSPAAMLRGRRVFGITANLYAVRSARSWGAGDATDLRYLVEWAAEQGAAFVGVNPLHALRNSGLDVSPYSPVSRLYRNPLYIDVEAVPELAQSAEARALLAAAPAVATVARLRASDRVDYEGVMAAKRGVLEALHREFARANGGARTRRGAEYRAWRDAQGDALERFATWSAIDDRLRAERGARAPWGWREWPEELRDPASDAVRAFRERHADLVDYHRWLQFELDRQIGAAAERGRALGMPVGLYQDLAIGTSDSGSDTWAFPGLFLDGVSVGAPPDPLAPHGQNWGLPPIDPHRLAAQGYEYWTRLLRSAFRHAGALRLDHVLGLFRQFWIPRGMPGERGAYMRFPSEDLLGIIALEAERAGAIAVGEDLGTVPPEVPPALERWGMLSSKVLYFERGAKGSFRPARAYARTALTTANTHDLASLAGFWTERDIELRAECGDLRGRAVGVARRNRDVDREALADLLAEEGLLPESDEPLDHAALRAAVHAFLRRTPSWLVGLALDDLLGETEPVNIPGLHPDRYPMWRVRQRAPLERLREDPDARRALGAERVWVP